MEIETLLEPRIWDAIRSNYENGDYTGAILDATHFLSNLIREKAGVEGDGVALVGQALGGKTPRLKLNKLQTETDWNIQVGIEQIIRGFYQGIRNPRSHEKYSDSKTDADAIIYFLHYLTTIIDKSRAPFTRADFLKRVFDPDFVPSNRYASLLIKEIPTKQRLDVFIDAYREKKRGEAIKLTYFFQALLKKLSKEERNQVYSLVSQELKEIDDIGSIILIIQILPRQCWEKFDEVARIRIENKLIRSIQEGQYDKEAEYCFSGQLGTWTTRIHKYFRLKSELLYALIRKLESKDKQDQDYVFKYFFDIFPELIPKPSKRLQQVIVRGLQNGDSRFHDALDYIMIVGGPEEWKKTLEEPYNAFKPSDDVPF